MSRSGRAGISAPATVGRWVDELSQLPNVLNHEVDQRRALLDQPSLGLPAECLAWDVKTADVDRLDGARVQDAIGAVVSERSRVGVTQHPHDVIPCEVTEVLDQLGELGGGADVGVEEGLFAPKVSTGGADNGGELLGHREQRRLDLEVLHDLKVDLQADGPWVLAEVGRHT